MFRIKRTVNIKAETRKIRVLPHSEYTHKNPTTPKENMMTSIYTRREAAAALTDTVKVCFQLFQ